MYHITMQKMTGWSRSEYRLACTVSSTLKFTPKCRETMSISKVISEKESQDDDRAWWGSVEVGSIGRNHFRIYNVGIGGFSNGANQVDCAMPRRRVRAISGRSWNNSIYPIPRSPVPSPAIIAVTWCWLHPSILNPTCPFSSLVLSRSFTCASKVTVSVTLHST